MHAGSIYTSTGNAYGPRAAKPQGARLLAFDRPLDTLLAFQARECTALVDDDPRYRSLLKQPDWSYYKALPGAIAPTPSFIATSGGDAASMRFINTTARETLAKQLAFDMFVAENDPYCR